jgi:ABC-type polysaccharide/polyol phosphate export permease
LVSSLYRYRWLLYELVLRDIVLRYRGSVLGFIWTFLNPLLAMGVYTLVFSIYLRVGIPNYAVFLLSGLLPWLWFAGALGMGATSIVDGRMYVSRSVFSPILLVLVPICSQAVNFVLSIPLLFGIEAIFGVHVGWPIVVLPVLVGIQFLLILGLLMSLATMNVFFRDLQQLMTTILSLLFYLAPIIYPLASVPAAFRPFVFINPMAALAIGYQDVFFYDRLPDPALTAYAFAVAVVLCLVGRGVFNRYRDAFADYA